MVLNLRHSGICGGSFFLPAIGIAVWVLCSGGAEIHWDAQAFLHKAQRPEPYAVCEVQLVHLALSPAAAMMIGAAAAAASDCYPAIHIHRKRECHGHAYTPPKLFNLGALIIRMGFWGYAGESLSKSIIKEDVICILSNSSEH